MTTNSIVTQDHLIDNLIFGLRGWLNWAVIAGAIARENLRRWPASWLLDVAAGAVATVLLVPAWSLYRLGALVGKLTRKVDSSTLEIPTFVNRELTIVNEPYAVIPVGDTLVLEIRTEPPALVIRKDGAALEVEPGELMALAGALTVAGGGLPELMKARGILWER